MATTHVAQSYDDSVYASTVDVKVPTTIELPVDDWPQHVTDILSPDLLTGETGSIARQLGDENDGVAATVSSTPMVDPSTEPSSNLPATSEATPMADPSTEPSTNLPATSEATPNTTPEDSLPSTPESSLPSTSDVDFPENSAALSEDNDFTLCERPFEKLALQIVDIILRYGHNNDAGTSVGKKFLPLVERSIEKSEPVKMVLPAFPCVSVFNCRPF